MQTAPAELRVACGFEKDPDDEHRRDGGYEERVEKLGLRGPDRQMETKTAPRHHRDETIRRR